MADSRGDVCGDMFTGGAGHHGVGAPFTAMTNARWNAADIVLCGLLLVGALWLIQQASGELSYSWDWRQALGYVSADGAPGLLLDGVFATIRLLLIAGAMSLLLGALAAAALMSPLRSLAVGYVEVLRNMPPLVFMFIFFYFTGTSDFIGGYLSALEGPWAEVVFGDPRRAGNFVAGALCLAIFEGAFFAEIMRAAVLSVPVGQWDAARAMGFSRWRAFRLVILPQARQNAAAPLAGQMILLIKDSAVLSVISVPELTFSAQEASSSSRQIFEIWLLAAGFYFILCWPLMRIARRLERRPVRSGG